MFLRKSKYQIWQSKMPCQSSMSSRLIQQVWLYRDEASEGFSWGSKQLCWCVADGSRLLFWVARWSPVLPVICEMSTRYKKMLPGDQRICQLLLRQGPATYFACGHESWDTKIQAWISRYWKLWVMICWIFQSWHAAGYSLRWRFQKVGTKTFAMHRAYWGYQTPAKLPKFGKSWFLAGLLKSDNVQWSMMMNVCLLDAKWSPFWSLWDVFKNLRTSISFIQDPDNKTQ